MLKIMLAQSTKAIFEVRKCVLAMLKTARLEGGLYECSFKLKLLELRYW